LRFIRAARLTYLRILFAQQFVCPFLQAAFAVGIATIFPALLPHTAVISDSFPVSAHVLPSKGGKYESDN
jgi:hypothetical protein